MGQLIYNLLLDRYQNRFVKLSIFRFPESITKSLKRSPNMFLLYAIVTFLAVSSSSADVCDEVCAIANCDAPNASQLCPNDCAPPGLNSNPECNADFGFVADVSASVENHWDDEKSFIKKLVQSVVISEQGGRAAVTSFSNMAELQIKFDDHIHYSTFETALDQIPYVGSTTKIDLGLEVALDEMFQVFNGMRPDVHQTMVLITDGQQAGVNFDLYRERFNQAGVRVIVVGVGNFQSRDIRHLTSDDADIYVASDFDELVSDEFIESITFCGEFVEKTPCRDKDIACPRYIDSGFADYCAFDFFTGWNGRYGCTKFCGLCS